MAKVTVATNRGTWLGGVQSLDLLRSASPSGAGPRSRVPNPSAQRATMRIHWRRERGSRWGSSNGVRVASTTWGRFPGLLATQRLCFRSLIISASVAPQVPCQGSCGAVQAALVAPLLAAGCMRQAFLRDVEAAVYGQFDGL